MKCCFCGPVKNCGKYLDKVVENVVLLASLFSEWAIVIFYDSSDDNSLACLKRLQTQIPNFFFFVNRQPLTPFRTHNLANARNYCLHFIRTHYSDYPFFAMMDWDDVNAKTVQPEVLRPFLQRNDWDALSFQTQPAYYDIWALSIYPFTFSYNHFPNNIEMYNRIQTHIHKLLGQMDSKGLLRCLSAFNGFALYRTQAFQNCVYDGHVRADLIPFSLLQHHFRVAQSKLIYPDYGHVKAKHEDCEHRSFHLQAIQKNQARIRISPQCLFV
jgi:glycosyltransferase involved in cell wall biosynthesis